MSDDLVDRLRGNCPSIPAMRDAAKEIERLRSALENLREINAKLCQRRDGMDDEIERLRKEGK